MTLQAWLRALQIPKVQLEVENLVLRQEIGASKRSDSRPRIKARDRISRVLVRRPRSGWRVAVGFVPPQRGNASSFCR